MMEDAPFHEAVSDAPAGGRAFWVETSDRMRIRAVLWRDGPRGTVVIFPGRTEFAEKYGRVVSRLAGEGLSVLVIDWRGQGLSHRFPTSPKLGHVDDFRDYQRDVAAVLGDPEVRALPGPWVMLGHSMGGCIGLRTLLERIDFCGAVFSAPMWHLQMRAATREITTKVTQFANLIGFGGRLTPGSSPGPTALAVSFEGNALTSDPEHYAWCTRQILAHSDLTIGGPSMQWTRAALEEMARLYVAPLPRIPVLALLGTEETVVSPNVIRAQIARMERGELMICQNARHEILMERAEIQDAVWARVFRFIDDLAEPRPGFAAVSR
jgi:lysophospholipase